VVEAEQRAVWKNGPLRARGTGFALVSGDVSSRYRAGDVLASRREDAKICVNQGGTAGADLALVLGIFHGQALFIMYGGGCVRAENFTRMWKQIYSRINTLKNY